MSEQAGRVGTGHKVLVVDDDAALAEMLQLVLRQEGFKRTGAPTAARPSAPSRVSSPRWCCST